MKRQAVQFLMGQCYAAFAQHQSIMLTMFLAGLVGGLTHCVAMCGPFVAAQVGCDGQAQTKLQRLSGAALLPYHFGRMTTYIFLGVVASLLSRQIVGTIVQQWVAVSFLSLAGVIFIVGALPQAKKFLGYFRFMGLSHIGDFIGKVAKPLFSKPTGFSGYGLGVLLGFLPCGLIFAVLMIVSTISPLAAFLAMALFAMGTFPALFLVGLSGQYAYRRWPNKVRKIAQWVMIFNGFSLLILAGNMIL